MDLIKAQAINRNKKTVIVRP